MSKRSEKAKAAVAEPAVEQTGAESQVSELEAANQAAIEEAAKANETPAKEKPVVVDEIPAGACEVYGKFDAASRTCKKCTVKEQCETKTASAKTKAGKPAKEKKERAPRANDGTFSIFGHCRGGSQAAIIEELLMQPTTVAEIQEKTGYTKSRITSHITWLVEKHSANCTKVVADGKLHFVLNQK